jgi:hypothetical protein
MQVIRVKTQALDQEKAFMSSSEKWIRNIYNKSLLKRRHCSRTKDAPTVSQHEDKVDEKDPHDIYSRFVKNHVRKGAKTTLLDLVHFAGCTIYLWWGGKGFPNDEALCSPR